MEIFSIVGKMPVSNEMLISIEIGIDISCLSSFRILAGTLLGPFNHGKIMTEENAGVVGVRTKNVG